MSVEKRGKGWIVRIYDPSQGKGVWVGTFPKKQAAQIAEGKAVEEAQKRHALAPTVAAFAESWLEQFPRPKESTEIYLRGAIKPFVRDFGPRLLTSITRREARSWALQHKPALQATRTMLNDARKVDLCESNPFAGLGFEGSKGRKDLEVPSRAEVERMAQIARDKHGPLFASFLTVAAFTGMRPGEMYALRWGAIDFKNDEIHVLEHFSSSSGTFTKPKNGLTRTIAMPKPAREALLELPRGDGLVFQTARGLPMRGSTLHYYWDPVRTKADYPTLHFYALRHFCASYLLNDLGLSPQDVAHQLGHTDGGVLVMKLYGHPSEALARERIKRAFGSNVELLRGISRASSEDQRADDAS